MTELENLDDLEASWAEWMVVTNDKGKITQGAAWRRDNPGEWEKLRLYYEQKGERPELATRTGKQMVELVDGIIEARDVPDEPPPEPEPGPSSPALWNGDWETGDRSQYGGLEYAGTFDGTPPASERVIVSKGVDGVKPLQGEWFSKMVIKAGDQYGGSSGWRTVFRQDEPIPKISAGHDSWWVFAVLLPSSYPGAGCEPFQTGPEFHQTKAPYVSVTGSAPFHFIARPDRFYVDVFGGRDRATTRYVAQDFAQNYARNVWHVVAFRYKHGLTPNGAFELWYAPKGGTLTRIVEKTGIGTMYEETQNYFMFGMYRKNVGTGDMVAYFDATREYKNGTDALAFARSLL